MRTNIVNTIFRKEIKEVLRDKRMLYLVILMPFFLYPVLFALTGSVGANQQEKLMQQDVTIYLSPGAKGTALEAMLGQDTAYKVVVQAFTEADLKQEKRTMGIRVADDYAARMAQGLSADVAILADESQDALDMRVGMLQGQLAALGQQIVQERLAARDLSAEFANPMRVEQVDLSPQEGGGRMMAFMLPFMILLFIFIGCIYIAIDITAGEKERRTLQTIFTTPTSTGEIIAGKFLAVASVGIVSAAMNILSLVFAMRIQLWLLDGAQSNFSMSLTPSAWAWMVLLVLLATLFLGAISLAVVLLANSYKEAQSYVSPLMMLVMIPSMLAGMPGSELTFQNAWVPVYNVALAISALLKGTADTTLMLAVTGASLLTGVLALYLASLTFGNENVITGEKVDWKSLLKGGK
jgi:sodium transport system permease protein